MVVDMGVGVGGTSAPKGVVDVVSLDRVLDLSGEVEDADNMNQSYSVIL